MNFETLGVSFNKLAKNQWFVFNEDGRTVASGFTSRQSAWNWINSQGRDQRG